MRITDYVLLISIFVFICWFVVMFSVEVVLPLVSKAKSLIVKQSSNLLNNGNNEDARPWYNLLKITFSTFAIKKGDSTIR